MTASATEFVGPLTLEALSRHPVETDVLALLPDGRIGHIVIADTADAIVVAPATAHWLGAMASGLAGDVITAACLATSAPVVVAPAMDGEMYAHPATRANVARLRDDFGYRIVEPEVGPLANGHGRRGAAGALPAIVDAVVAAVGDRPVRAPSAASRPPVVAPFARRISTAATSSSPPAARPSRSTRSGSSAIARPARWASPSPRRPSRAGRA